MTYQYCELVIRYYDICIYTYIYTKRAVDYTVKVLYIIMEGHENHALPNMLNPLG